jgi:hypothetical protein
MDTLCCLPPQGAAVRDVLEQVKQALKGRVVLMMSTIGGCLAGFTHLPASITPIRLSRSSSCSQAQLLELTEPILCGKLLSRMLAGWDQTSCHRS